MDTSRDPDRHTVQTQHAKCDFCNDDSKEEHDDDWDPYECDLCLRTFHRQCIIANGPPQGYQLPERDSEQQWLCMDCTAEASYNSRPEHKWYRVQWSTSAEPSTEIEHANPTAVDTFKVEQNRLYTEHLRHKLAPRDHSLTNLERQGEYPGQHDTPYDTTLGCPVRDKLTIHPHSVNPHTDICATGYSTIVFREVLRRDRRRTHTVMAACLHDPNGSTIATLCPIRMDILYAAYNRASLHNDKHQPRSSMPDESFADALARLTYRYKEGAAVLGTTRKVKLSNHWATPGGIYEQLQRSLGLTKERFASPLNYNPCFH